MSVSSPEREQAIQAFYELSLYKMGVHALHTFVTESQVMHPSSHVEMEELDGRHITLSFS
jgi:hypothetical protein